MPLISVDTITTNVAPNKRLLADSGADQLGRDDFGRSVDYNDAMPSDSGDFPVQGNPLARPNETTSHT